jgi:hypothetical protein
VQNLFILFCPFRSLRNSFSGFFCRKKYEKKTGLSGEQHVVLPCILVFSKGLEKGFLRNMRLLSRILNLNSLLGRGLGSVVLLGMLFLLLSPVPVLVVGEQRGEGASLLEVMLTPFQPVVTRYIHSVERTPVEDEYYPSHGTLWQWEERVRSHNAGLPFLLRPQSSFFQDASWMHFRGGGSWYASISLRVGTEEFGRNQLELPGFASWDLFRLFPGKLLVLRVEEVPLALAVLRLPWITMEE